MGKSNKKGIIIGAVAVCAVIGALTPDKNIESIEIAIPNYQVEYDVNTEIPIDISVLPDGANADSIEYMTNSDSIIFSDAMVNTGNVEGTYEIYVTSDDIKSNILSIYVVDISAREEAKKKAEEELLAKATEEQELTDEQATEEEETQKAAEEQNSKESEEGKMSEAQSDKGKANPPDANISDATPSDASASDTTAQSAPAPAEESTPIETPAVPEESTTKPVGEMVWISATGKKYHSINNCGKMNPDKARQIPLEDATRNYEKCSNCW